MEFKVQLYLREHRNGFFSLEVIGEPSLCAYGEDLERAREELELVLYDRLERLHPRHLSRYAAPEGLRLEAVEVRQALEVQGAVGPERVSTRMAVLVARERKWLRFWLPRWGVRHWVPVQDDIDEAVNGFMESHLRKMQPAQRLALRFERREWLETITIDADPAPLESFTGKLRGADSLPEPTPKPEEEREGEEEEAPEGEEGEDKAPSQDKGKKGKKPKKKKRPPTPTLKRIGVSLSAQAKEQDLERAYGRARELEELLGLIQAPGASAFVVLGPSGVGKSTLLHELVYRIADKRTPKKLRERPVFFVDASRLIAGDGWFGDWQRQCLDVVQECIDAEVIWYIGDPLLLLDAGKSAQSEQNVALLLKPFLAGRRVTVLAECTPRAWAQVELRDASFARLFNPYRLEEPSQPQTRLILEAVARELEEDTGVHLTQEGLRAVEDLCRRFSGDNSRLGTSLHFLRRLVDEAAIRHDQALATARLDRPDATLEPMSLGRAEAVARFCEETGMPAFLVRDDQPMDPEAVLQHFQSRIIGQGEAVRRMTDLVSLMKAGLSDLNRPLGSFLFVGPTGVGKTEMAKALAEFLFGRRDRMIRFDMSEFISPMSVHRFLGDDGQEGALISQVRRSPFCVLLLDEIEKAHPAVFDVLLQVLGEARLTDQAGRTADFRNTVVLMTSNLGVETWKGGVGFGAEAVGSFRDHFLAEAERFFRPEFFNRLDHIVPFMPLEAEAIDRITGRELDHFLAREGLRQRELNLELDPTVHTWVAQRGVEPRYGARPLKRLIEHRLTGPLARHLSGQKAVPGRTVAVEPQGESLAFHNVEGGGRQQRSSVKGRLLRFLDQIGQLRYQTQRWLESFPYREMVQGLRLLDRLSQDRNFWKDQRRAEERMRHSQAERDLQHAFEGLRGQIASLEDLAYESYYDRNEEPLEMLLPELDASLEKLDELEWSLFARRFERPDVAMLYLQAGQNAQSWMRELVTLYVGLAEQRGWTVSARFAFEDPEKVAAREQQRQQRQQRRGKKNKEGEEAAGDQVVEDQKAHKDKKSRDPADWEWKALGRHAPRQDEESDGDWFNRRNEFLNEIMGKEEGTLVALRFEGPHAPCLLCAEDGVHSHQDGGEQFRVKVLFGDVGDGGPENPVHVMRRWSEQPRRLIKVSKHLVEDPGVDMALPMEPRLYRVYERMMRAAMYDQVFEPGAHKLFDRRHLGGAP